MSAFLPVGTSTQPVEAGSLCARCQEVKDAVWAATVVAAAGGFPPVEPPSGAGRLCFEGILVRLVKTAERLLGCAVSDTTLRARRDEWIDAVVDFDRIVGLDLTEVASTGPPTKPPAAVPTGRNPTDRGKSGWKWSLLTDRAGIPVGWAADGANRHDQVLFEPTLATAADRGLLEESRPCTWTAATTAPRSGPAPPTGASTTSSAPADDHTVPPRTKPPPHSGCDGPSNGPTRGYRTSDNSAATPTGTPTTDSPNSPSPSSYSSASNSSTGETAGHHLSANALSGDLSICTF